MKQKLSHLLREIEVLEIVGDTDKNIVSLNSDSRKVEKEGMFVAVKGVTTDGHKYIPVVASTHVGAIVCEQLPSAFENGVTYIRVADTAKALGMLASAWYGHPSSKLKLVGVTGTNGKTTTATLLYEMARLEGYKAGLLSTVCNYVDGRAIPTTHTTPDPLTLNALLAEMVDAGCDYAFMEVSSHAFALVNADDKAGAYMLQNTKARTYTYSLRTQADFHCKILETRLDGTLMQLNGRDVEVQFTGRFNAYNLTAVYGAAILTGFNPEEVLVNMSRLVPVAGRFQTMQSPSGFTAIVDYAHTPDALVNVLDTIRDIVGAEGEIITVVGAGGDRDHGKRPMMAREAACRSDRLILTSDNPRTEQPNAIINDMKAGLSASELSRTICITDRAEAIRTACALAGKGTVILVAGKGHETYQEINGVRHHFDDREVLAGTFGE